MRILIATTNVDIVGGVETYLRALLPALRERGHELAVLSERPGYGADSILANASDVAHWHSAKSDALHRCRDWQPDVCFCQGLSDPDLERALVERFPTVFYAHNYHGTCISGTKRHAFPNATPCDRVFGASCLVHYFPRRCGGLNPLTMRRQFGLTRQRHELLPRYRRVLVASGHMRREYERHGVPAGRLQVVPLFAPSISPDPIPPDPTRTMTGRLLFVGRLSDLKGGVLLMHAVASVRKSLSAALHLTVAGDGPERARLEMLAKQLDLEVDFRGWVGDSERTRLMRQADLLVMPSVWPEPFGLVGIEAGCVGMPTVAFDVGGIRDWLETGVSGELAPGNPPRIAGLAAALLRALETPSHWQRLRLGAWTLSRRFTLEGHCHLLEGQFASVAERALAEVP